MTSATGAEKAKTAVASQEAVSKFAQRIAARRGQSYPGYDYPLLRVAGRLDHLQLPQFKSSIEANGCYFRWQGPADMTAGRERPNKPALCSNHPWGEA